MIVYDPANMLQKIAPPSKIKKLVSENATLKKTNLSFVSDIDFLSKKSIEKTALKTLKGYRARIKEDSKQKKDLVKNPAQLIQRVQNEVLREISVAIVDKYAGEEFIWLPSSASEPDPEHQLLYGQKFVIGSIEMPGERPGCQCGMQILVDETKLEL